VGPIKERMRKGHLRWFGHVQGTPNNVSVRKNDLIKLMGWKAAERGLKGVRNGEE
jgi:hypothetical protein